MKFWQKAFLSILILFCVSINISIYLTSRYSFSLNIQQETARDMDEYQFISNGIYDSINSLYNRQETKLTATAMNNLMSSFANYYTTQGVYLELIQSHKRLFSNIPATAQSGIKADTSAQAGLAVKILSNKSAHYLAITGPVNGPLGDYTFAYVCDLSALYNSHAQLVRYLMILSTAIEVSLAITLFFILRRLTRPIRLLQTATRKIAGGVYDERVRTGGKDEFHDLAENFNLMAESIQEKIHELASNVQEKQRLIDNVAHELRTPLTAIRGHAEYLQNARADEQNRVKAAGYIMSAADRMNDLVHKILDLAFVRNSKLDFQEIKPSELLSQVKQLTAEKLNEKEIRLEVNCTLEDRLLGDPVLLQSLLVNLIDNAAKASANCSVIQLSAYFDSAPTLEVKDDGCGMEDNQLALILEPFYRVDTARSRSSGGVGLGLTLCNEIANLHNASLQITSQPGKGTTVRVIFTTSLRLTDSK